MSNCDICLISKDENIKLPGFLQPLPIPEKTWGLISMDLIDGLPKSGDELHGLPEAIVSGGNVVFHSS